MPSLSEFERLFLLEFFVDSVYIKNPSVNDDETSLCVSFQFLNYPVMIVCEEDFGKKTKSLTKGTSVIFKTGKSCLFSLRTDQSNSLPTDFDLTIKVFQNIKKNGEFSKTLVAEAVIKLGSSFTNLMKNSNKSEIPAAYDKQDTFPLKDANGEQIGNLAAFVRLSCFGKLIVTQFQLGGEDAKNYMFKGTDPKKIFPEDDSVIRPIDSLHGVDYEKSEEEIPGDTPYKDLFGYPKESKEDVALEEDEEEGEDENWDQKEFDDGKAAHEQISKDEQDKMEPDEGEKEENYKILTAEINGNSITIRVLKKGKRAKRQSEKLVEEIPQIPQSPPCQEVPPTLLCMCQPRCPPSFASIPPLLMSQGPQIGNYTQLQGSNLSQCPREDCPLGLYSTSPQQIQNPTMDSEPGTVTMKGDQVYFQMANRQAGEQITDKEKKLANSIHYKLGTGEAGKEGMKNTIQITPQNPGEPFITGAYTGGGGPVSGLPIDNKQDTFLLKVQQNNDSVNAKSKLEMELRTPKTTETKPDSNTKDTQYITTDFPVPEKKSMSQKLKKKKK